MSLAIRTGLYDGSTDPLVLAGLRAVTADRIGLDSISLDKLISRINATSKTVSPGQLEL